MPPPSPLLFDTFFAAELHVVLARFSEEGIVQNLVHLHGDGVSKVEEPLACLRRAV